MRSTGRQEEKDETNLQIQNLKSLTLLSLKYFTKTEKKKNQHYKQVFKAIILHYF